MLYNVKSKMAAIDHSEKQEFTFFTHWYPSARIFLHACMHLGRKHRIMVLYPTSIAMKNIISLVIIPVMLNRQLIFYNKLVNN